MAAIASPISLPFEHLIVVRRKNLRWEVAVDGVTRRMIDWLCTKERAIAHALEMANAISRAPAAETVRVVVEEGA